MTARGVERVPSNGAGQGVDQAAQSGACVELCRLAAMSALVMIGGAIGGEIAGASANAGGAPPHAQPAPLIGIETGRQKFSEDGPAQRMRERGDARARAGRRYGLGHGHGSLHGDRRASGAGASA